LLVDLFPGFIGRNILGFEIMDNINFLKKSRELTHTHNKGRKHETSKLEDGKRRQEMQRCHTWL